MKMIFFKIKLNKDTLQKFKIYKYYRNLTNYPQNLNYLFLVC